MSDTASEIRTPRHPLCSTVRRPSTTLEGACKASVISRLSAKCEHAGTLRYAVDQFAFEVRVDEQLGPRMPTWR